MAKQLFVRQLFKPALVVTLALATFVGLIGNLKSAHAAGKATYNVVVGTDTSYGLETLAFFPQTLKVHRGDTVNWQFRGFHNVRFDQKPLDLVVVSDIDGKKAPEFNPNILFPNVKPSDTAKPGANSGVTVFINPTAPVQTLVIDLAPGAYNYLCDVHPGMIGTIVVVDDKTSIPSPTDIDKSNEAEVTNAIGDGDKAILSALKTYSSEAKDGKLQVAAGLQENATAVTRFFPEDATVPVGTSVTWTVPSGFDIHTVNFPLATEGRIDIFNPVMDSKKSMHALVTEAANPNVKSGVDLPADGFLKSGLIAPKQSFTVKFTKPGVYKYYCAIHATQFGTIEVVAPPGQ